MRRRARLGIKEFQLKDVLQARSLKGKRVLEIEKKFYQHKREEGGKSQNERGWKTFPWIKLLGGKNITNLQGYGTTVRW